MCVFYVPFLPLLPSRLARFSCVLPFLLRKEYFFYFTVVLGNQREFSFFSSPRLKTCFGIFFSSSFFVGCQSNVPRLEECQCGGYRKRLLIPRLRVGENVYCSKYKKPSTHPFPSCSKKRSINLFYFLACMHQPSPPPLPLNSWEPGARNSPRLAKINSKANRRISLLPTSKA